MRHAARTGVGLSITVVLLVSGCSSGPAHPRWKRLTSTLTYDGGAVRLEPPPPTASPTWQPPSRPNTYLVSYSDGDYGPLGGKPYYQHVLAFAYIQPDAPCPIRGPGSGPVACEVVTMTRADGMPLNSFSGPAGYLPSA